MRAETIEREQIFDTYQIIRPYVRRTPVIETAGTDVDLDGGTLSLKLECLQQAGSFKARGAFANLLTRTVPAAAVVAASGGITGQPLPSPARKLGRPATIFVPSVTSASKLDRIRGDGAQLVISGERYADALATSEQWAAETGANDSCLRSGRDSAGPGTTGLEFEEQCPGLDTLVVAVGGGELIGGIAAWYGRRVRLIGVEPGAAPTRCASRLSPVGRRPFRRCCRESTSRSRARESACWFVAGTTHLRFSRMLKRLAAAL